MVALLFLGKSGLLYLDSMDSVNFMKCHAALSTCYDSHKFPKTCLCYSSCVEWLFCSFIYLFILVSLA